MLNLPIITTNYSTVCDQIIDGETGIIVDMNTDAVVAGIKKMLDKDIREYIKSRQVELCKGNEQEVEKLYMLIVMEIYVTER